MVKHIGQRPTRIVANKKVPDLKFSMPDARFVHTRLTSNVQMKKIESQNKYKVQEHNRQLKYVLWDVYL